MANRLFRSQFVYSFIGAFVKLFAQVSIGATGAPTLTTAKSKGIYSIARNSAGKYTITLSDIYNDLLNVNVSVLFASGDPGFVNWVIRSHTVASTKTVVLEFLDETGVAIELSSGCVLRLSFELKNSSV